MSYFKAKDHFLPKLIEIQNHLSASKGKLYNAIKHWNVSFSWIVTNPWHKISDTMVLILISCPLLYMIFSFQSRDKSCDLQLVQREMCSSDVPQCSGSSFYKSAPSDWLPDDTCATTEWSDWSPCSVGCGTGFRARTRRFFNRMGRKKCPHVDTVMKQTCQGHQDTCQDQVAKI